MGTHLAISSTDIVLVGVSTNFWIAHSPCSVPQSSVHCSHYFQGSPLLFPGKYQLICNFLSSSPHQNNNNPLPLLSVLCGVSNVLDKIFNPLTQTNLPKIWNMSMNSDGGAYCSDLLLMWFLQLHAQYMQLMMLCHDVLLYSLVSMPESYF